jgi:hypothetical protein
LSANQLAGRRSVQANALQIEAGAKRRLADGPARLI